MQEEQSLPHGAVLDRRYRIVSLIKAGGMGSVYRAEDLKLNGKTCAIKEMIESFDNATDRQAGIDRFLSEVQVMETMAPLQHPARHRPFPREQQLLFR